LDQKNFRPPALISIMLADDGVPFRRTLRELIGLRPELLVVCEAGDGKGAVQCARQFQPDFVILDLNLPKLSGIDVARRIGRVSQNSNIIFMSMEHSIEIVVEAFRLGAKAYVYKGDFFEIFAAIDSVRAGDRFVSSSLSKTHTAPRIND
jgi:two-component system, NarL family, response regulator DegU